MKITDKKVHIAAIAAVLSVSGGVATAQTLAPFEEDGQRFTPAIQVNDLIVQMGYLLPRAPALAQDLRQAARAGLPSWRSRQLDLRDQLGDSTSGGGWGRLHGDFGSRELGPGDVEFGEGGIVDRDVYQALLDGRIADWVDARIPDDITDPVARQELVDAVVKDARRLDHDTSLYGFNVGFDLIFGKVEASRWLLGGTVGYLRSRSEFDDLQNWGGGSQFDGDTVNVGLYGGFVSGGFYVDAALSQAWHSVDMDLPLMQLRPAGSMLGTKGSSVSGQIDLGWKPALDGGRFYVEPVAGLVWVRTDIDDTNVQPADALVLGSQGSRLSFGEQESLRGNIGVRVGTAPWAVGRLNLKGELGWRTWREFRGETTATLGLRGTWLDLGDPAATAVPGYYDLPVADAKFAKGGTELSLGLGLSSSDGRASSHLTLVRHDGDRYESDAVTIGFRFQW